MSLPQMSLHGTVLVVIITLLRTVLLSRLPKRTFLALWAVAVARLLVPFSLPSPWSVYTLLARGPVQTQTAVSAVTTAPGAGTALAAVQTVSAPSTAAHIPVWAVLWGIGTALCALYFTVTYLRCRREFAASLPVTRAEAAAWLAEHRLRRPLELRESQMISTPLTYGIFHPVILMPKTTDWDDMPRLRFVLAHEVIHIRRFDALTKLVLAATLCLHWWNPLVWVLYALANRDLELSCDEAVVRQFGHSSRSAYARTLIAMEETRRGPRPLCSSFGKNAIEERIVSIMKLKKASLLSSIAAIVLVAGVAAVFVTSAAAKDSPEAVTESASGSSYADDLAYLPAAKADFSQEGELLQGYEEFGISYDADGYFYYEGQLVRYFWDGVEVLEDGEAIGWTVRYEYLNPDGVVDVRTIRDTAYNPDGSFNTAGPVTGMRASTQEEFDALDVEALMDPSRIATEETDVLDIAEDADTPQETSVETAVETDSSSDSASTAQETAVETAVGTSMGTGGRTCAEIFADYASYGVTYEELSESSGVTGCLYYNGQPVKCFLDASMDSTFQWSTEGDGIFVEVIRDGQGQILDVTETDSDSIITTLSAVRYSAAQWAAELAPYLPFGLTYTFDETAAIGDNVTMYYHGQEVSGIWDPQQGTWIAQHIGGSGVTLEAVYESGQLTGLKIQ